LLEVFIFDFDDTIYGKRIGCRIRPQAARRGALRRSRRADAQIEADVAQARDFFACAAKP
jgi:FAD synthase